MFLYNGPSISRVNTIRITFVVWVNWTTVTIFYTFILYRQTQLALSVQMYFSPYVSYFFFCFCFVLFRSRAFHFSITDFIYIHWLLTLVIIFFFPTKKKISSNFYFFTLCYLTIRCTRSFPLRINGKYFREHKLELKETRYINNSHEDGSFIISC